MTVVNRKQPFPKLFIPYSRSSVTLPSFQQISGQQRRSSSLPPAVKGIAASAEISWTSRFPILQA